MNELIINFKRWLKNNGFDDQEKILWWNVDTGFPFILQLLKNINQTEIKFLNSTFENLKKNGNKIKISGLSAEKSYAAFHQYFTIGILFGAIKIDESFQFKSKNEFMNSWARGELSLKFSNIFLNSNTIIDFLYGNQEELLNNFLFIQTNLRDTFIYKEMYKILFDLYLIYLEYSNKLLPNSDIYRDILDKHKQKNNSDIKSWAYFYSSNLTFFQFSVYLFEEQQKTRNELNSSQLIDENKSASIGLIGEYLFNIFAKNKQRFLSKIDNPSVEKIKFNKLEWSSQTNKYCEYDFAIDGNFFEVKSTAKNYTKDSFIISHNEYEHMKKFEDYSYICYLKDIDIDKVDFKNESKNFEIINKLSMSFLTFDDLTKKFNITNKGYWVVKK